MTKTVTGIVFLFGILAGFIFWGGFDNVNLPENGASVTVTK
jgi:hypothetical protein